MPFCLPPFAPVFLIRMFHVGHIWCCHMFSFVGFQKLIFHLSCLGLAFVSGEDVGCMEFSFLVAYFQGWHNSRLSTGIVRRLISISFWSDTGLGVCSLDVHISHLLYLSLIGIDPLPISSGLPVPVLSVPRFLLAFSIDMRLGMSCFSSEFRVFLSC